MRKPRPDDWHVGPRGTSSMMTSGITVAPQLSFSDAFPLKRVRLYSLIPMRGFVGIMLHQEAWSGRLFGKVSTGRLSPMTWLRL
jgi:hypothetical protein